MRRLFAVTAVAASLLPGCTQVVRLRGTNPGLARALAPRPRPALHPGLARFVLDDFGLLDGLGTSTLPWKLTSTALVMAHAPALGRPVDASALQPVLERYGFVFPRSIDNLPGGPDLRGEPLGHVRGEFRTRVPLLQVEARSVGCAACHAGRLHDAAGRPTERVWLGAPNTSLDLKAYARDTAAALRAALAEPRALVDAMDRVHPGTPRGERWLSRHLIVPRLARLLRARDMRGLPLDMGGPGLANGLAAVKLQIVPHGATGPTATSMPALWSRGFRSALLWDGAYGVAGEPRFRAVTRDEATAQRVAGLGRVVAWFTLTSPRLFVARSGDAAAVRRVVETMEGVGHLEKPAFPGPVDPERAGRGRRVYADRCAACHGVYDEHARLVEYPNRRVPQRWWRTDPTRWRGIDDAVLAWRDANPRHAFARDVDLARTGGYVAPILDGLWLTAPYLHNGSVPTLHALMHPGERPARFEVGGHALDYARMGIALEPHPDGTWRFPRGYVPTSRPAVRDTAQPGLSNSGHVEPFRSMSEDDRNDVLEFLKTL